VSKFNENPSSGRQVVPCGLADTKTDRQAHNDRRTDMMKPIVADSYLWILANKTTISYLTLTLQTIK